jgi:hypothetical protein
MKDIYLLLSFTKLEWLLSQLEELLEVEVIVIDMMTDTDEGEEVVMTGKKS